MALSTGLIACSMGSGSGHVDKLSEADRKIRSENAKESTRRGKAGEKAVRDKYDIGGKKRIKVNGKVRISDRINDKLETVSEIKNVKKLGYTRQLQAYAKYAKRRKYKFDLYVRRDTYLTQPLHKAIRDGKIRLHYIPGT